MKIIQPTLLLCLYLFLSVTLSAQKGKQEPIPDTDLTNIIDSIARVVERTYIDLEIGKKVGHYIQQRHNTKAYQNLTYQELGKQLTKDLRSASNDIHMSAFYSVPKATQKGGILESINHKYGAISNFGFVETKIKKDNVGYLKIAHFTQWQFFEQAKQAADNSMRVLQNTDALIIDLRNNPGGFEDIVAYLMSYFLEGPERELQAYYCRYLNTRRAVSVTARLPAKKRPDLPVYILINEHTGSAAESFAYMMKHLGRATLLGETTAGAGNGASIFRISNQFAVQVATVETINAVTKQSWEKVGVIPDIPLKPGLVDSKVDALAKEAAQKYRTKLMEGYKNLLNDLDEELRNHSNSSSDAKLIAALRACQEAQLYNESSINGLGYEFLGEKEKPTTAEVIFKTNTLIYPNRGNVFDSYAEALSINGKLKLALQNYEKAVALGEANNDPSLPIYLENLQNLRKRMK